MLSLLSTTVAATLIAYGGAYLLSKFMLAYGIDAISYGINVLSHFINSIGGR